MVAIAPDNVDGLRRHLAANDYPFTLLADPDGSVFDAYDVTSRMASLGQQPGLIGNQQWDLVKPSELGRHLAKLDD
jgi:peroxiredoxin